jgi:tryptophan synthase alpha subunit
VAEVADGVIVGSAIVKRMAAAADSGDDPAEVAAGFIREMSDAARGLR